MTRAESLPVSGHGDALRRPERENKCVQAGGQHCPVCGVGDVQGHDIHIGGGGAMQECTGSVCEAERTDFFVLTDYSLA